MSGALLSSFTPSLMRAEDLEALFVQREELAQRLVDLIRESTLTEAKHHHLLIGPRGIGKTHIVALTYYRVQAMEDLRGKLLVAWMREEEWGVTSFLDLLLRIFRALIEEYKDAEFEQKVQELYRLSPKEAEHEGAELLKEYVGDRTLLILGENWDDLFNGLGDEGQKRLRSYLQENPFCSILATAQSLFNGVKLQTSPFYGFFHLSHLAGLSHDEATHLLANIAQVSGDADLAALIITPMGRARVRAVHHLARGNHRVYVIFSQFLTRESLDELVRPFMRTLDELTPYYQARMQWLSPQQRKIVEFLCDRRSAVTVKEIAQHCFMTHQTTSGQLKILRDMGYIESQRYGRESCYEVHEPLMRLCIEVKKSRGEPIRLFVDFLRSWYSPAELSKRLEFLRSTSLEWEYVTYALQVAGEDSDDPQIDACMKDYRTHFEKEDFGGALKVVEELIAIRGNTEDVLEKGLCLGLLERHNEALMTFDGAIEMAPQSARAWSNRGASLAKLGRPHEALTCCDKAIEFGPGLSQTWGGRGAVLAVLGRSEEALADITRAIEIDSNDVNNWEIKGKILFNLGRLEEALTAFERLSELDLKGSSAWLGRAFSLLALGRAFDALPSIERALEIDPTLVEAWRKKGEILFSIGRFDEALSCIDKEIELAPELASAWENRGTALMNLGNQEQALIAIEKSIQLAGNESTSWNKKGAILAIMGRKEEALTAFDKAIRLAPNDPNPWNNKGNVFARLERWEDALNSFEKCIEVDSTQSSLSYFSKVEALLSLGRWEEGYSALDEALGYFANSNRENTDYAGFVTRNAATLASDFKMKKERIKDLIRLYDKHQLVLALGQGLVLSIKELVAPNVRNEDAKKWRDAWSELASNRKEFETPIRLVDMAVRYKEIKDERVLLELPIEERDLLKPLLAKGEETPQAEISVSKKPKKRQTPSRSRRGKRAMSPAKQTG